MLVDDSQTFLNAAIDFLRRHQEIHIAGAVLSGEEALAQAERLRPDVILTDLDMPGLTGLELISYLRKEMPQVTVIAVTMLDAEAYRRAAIDAGAHAFVRKGALVTDLIPAIRRLAPSGCAAQNHWEDHPDISHPSETQ